MARVRRATRIARSAALVAAISVGSTVTACKPDLRPSDLAAPPTASPPAEPAAAAVGPGDVPSARPPEGVEIVLGLVDPARLRASVDRLAAFGTRHTLSDTVSTVRGIGAARRWIEAELRAASVERGGAPPMIVAFDSHRVKPDGKRIDREVDVVNVIATLPGTRPEAATRRVYVVGHYDSRASNPMDATSDAPGANDDGSGTALVLELARVLAPRSLDATVVFMASAGEEQGLVGARAHARAAKQNGDDVRAVLSFDIVGDPAVPGGPARPDAIRLFSEGLPLAAAPEAVTLARTLGTESDAPSRQLARFVEMLAAWHGTKVRPTLVFRPDRFLRGGDHTAFAEQGYTAVRFTEHGEHYERQHQDVREENGTRYGDVTEHVDAHYLAELTRLAAVAVLHLANAPASPADARVVATELTTDTTLRWSAPPDRDVAGYEVVWRATTSARWEHLQATTGTEITLPLHKDEFLFGVRSFDAEGWRSPVVACGIERAPS
jgi:Zn-dependent M28 family amino/carboxypeptidase